MFAGLQANPGPYTSPEPQADPKTSPDPEAKPDSELNPELKPEPRSEPRSEDHSELKPDSSGPEPLNQSSIIWNESGEEDEVVGGESEMKNRDEMWAG